MVLKKPLQYEPTRTLSIRKRAVREIRKRYKQVAKLIYTSVAVNKVFSVNASVLTESDFVFLRQSEKLERFDSWLKAIIAEIILQDSLDLQDQWLIQYIEEGYLSGVEKARIDIGAFESVTEGRNVFFKQPSPLSIPLHSDKAIFLFTRDFTQLKGITETMAQQINQVLSEGLLKGLSPRDIARKMVDRVDKIGITRTTLLARTEVVNAHNLASIQEGRVLSETFDTKVYYYWITAGDDRVRKTHVERNKKYYKYETVSKLIGEPNCRCAVVPVFEKDVPKGNKVT